jgi:hypothetical protein
LAHQDACFVATTRLDKDFGWQGVINIIKGGNCGTWVKYSLPLKVYPLFQFGHRSLKTDNVPRKVSRFFNVATLLLSAVFSDGIRVILVFFNNFFLRKKKKEGKLG